MAAFVFVLLGTNVNVKGLIICSLSIVPSSGIKDKGNDAPFSRVVSIFCAAEQLIGEDSQKGGARGGS
jgi:hypothetical protein